MKFDDCKPGMRVAHISLGDGVVQSVTDTVNVTFDRMTARNRPLTGKYDRLWFDMHPKHLFGRGEP